MPVFKGDGYLGFSKQWLALQRKQCSGTLDGFRNLYSKYLTVKYMNPGCILSELVFWKWLLDIQKKDKIQRGAPGLWGSHHTDSEIRESRSFFHWTHRTGWNKEHFFFPLHFLFYDLSPSDPWLRISVLKHIKIQTATLPFQHYYFHHQVKNRWRQWCGCTLSMFNLKSWSHQ